MQAAFPWQRGRASPTAVPVTLGPMLQWVRVGAGLSYAAFAAAALTKTLSLFALPPGALIHGIKIKHSAAFSGGSIATYTIEVGDIGNASLYASPFNVLQAPGADVYWLNSDFGGESMIAATEIYVTATATGADTNAATTGAVDIWALLSIAS